MKDQVINLEIQLLHSAIRRNILLLDDLISDDFIEFGASGSIYTKDDVLKYLPEEDSRTFKVDAMSATHITDSCILVTYRLVEEERETLRSSIWRFQNGKWQMVFHQGTVSTVK